MHKRRAELKVLPNYRLGMPALTGLNQQWSSDVTYIRLGKRHVFLAVVVDLWSRRIIGWSLHATLSTAALVIGTRKKQRAPELKRCVL